MHPFQVVMIICVTLLALLSALFMVLRNIPRTNPGHGWWMLSSIALAFSYLLAFIFFGEKQTLAGELIFYALNMFAILTLYIGNSRFIRFSLSIKKHFIILAFTFSIAATLRAIFTLEFASDIVFVAYTSSYLFHSAYKYFINEDQLIPYRKPVTILLTILGVHFLDYPFLHNVEWFAPIGFLIAIMATATIFIFITMMALTQFKERVTASEREAVHAATHDTLTGLYNRLALDTLFRTLVDKTDQEKASFAILYLDLDGFKQVNDTYGHKAGDLVLQVVTKRLKDKLNNIGDIARIGGDEFVALCQNLKSNDSDALENNLNKLLTCIKEPIPDKGNTYQVSSSIGISFYPENGETLEQLLSFADKAMYEAKKNGADGYRLAFPEQEKHIITSFS